MNGAAAHLIKQGEEIIIMGFELSQVPIHSKVILTGPGNRVVRFLQDECASQSEECDLSLAGAENRSLVWLRRRLSTRHRQDDER